MALLLHKNKKAQTKVFNFFIKYYRINSIKALGIYAVTTVTKSSTTTPTLCCPCHLATLPITPLNAPSVTLTNCPFSNFGTFSNDTIVLSDSAPQIICRL